MFFTVQKIENQLKEIRKTVHREICDIPWFKFVQGEAAQASTGAHCPEFDDHAWTSFRVGDTWGGYDVQAWFRAWVPIPPHFKDKNLALRFLVGPRDGGGSTAETLLYVNGFPLQAIDIWHEEAWLPAELVQQDKILIALKAWSGVLEVPERRRFKVAQLVWIDQAAESFTYRCEPLLKAAKVLAEDDLRRVNLLQVLNGAFLKIDFFKPRSDAYYRSLQEADAFLQERLAGLESVQETKPKVIGIGHAHIDMAWLWRLCHTREKAARTFTTALHLMRQYPEYRFLHSSPQLYKYLKADYPEIFAQVKEKIASGRWEINGGMWVEADTNLPGGESLVRQFLLGRQFARAEFGVEMKTLWLPDVFGYSWALPQIIQKSGLKYFLTSKISWSQFNRFPYDTFYWRGIDGTELLTHFVTTPEPNSWMYTYNGQLEPSEVKGIWDNYRQKETNSELLALYGWGDGGGGPTREMLESARALKNLPGLPQVELGTAESYFERLEQRLREEDVPVWDGELYLEYHRGTYTSQAYNKRANRKSEILFHDAEWLSVVADLVTGESHYLESALREGWELILLNQFHDILPGSSIREVYEDSRLDYAVVEKIGEEALEQSKAAVASRLAGDGDQLVVFNSLSWKRSGLLELPWSTEFERMTLANTGGASPVQISEIDGRKSVLLQAGDVPAFGYRAFSLVDRDPAQEPANELSVSPQRLENRFYRIQLNEKGQLASIWDKRNGREVLAPGRLGNVFQVFEDKPLNFDAWDIDIYYQEKMREIDDLVDVQVEEAGPLRATLHLRWRFYDSLITQRLSLFNSSPRIDFRTEVDWQERQALLKVAFPVDVRSTRATYDIQFGNIERPTHWNTSWDYARFETVAHKWVDLSEGNYGVSLLNDCKYGCDVKKDVLRLTLIKSGIHPDPTADQGRHLFTYSLLPHSGDWRTGGVVQEAYALNYPLHTQLVPAGPPGGAPAEYGFAEVNADHVIIETVKKAELDDAWIVRVYEYQQCRSRAVRIRFGQPLRNAVECNLMEEDDRPVSFSGDQISFPIAPYEIKTFKVWF